LEDRVKLGHDLIEELRVRPGARADLAARSTSSTRTRWIPAGDGGPGTVAEQDLEQFKSELADAQGLLYAADRWSLLLVFQGLDAAGKDGTIKHVMSGVNPQGCQVFSFKQPSALELRHDFLWRTTASLPERGRIGIFNRSHYEEVLVVRVHPALLEAQRLPPGVPLGTKLWAQRYEDINAFERHLHRNGTRTVKFFLHVSKDEQRRRLLERLDDPEKQWKFSPADVAEHERFADYQDAYEDAIGATSTEWAPWYVIPADHKHAMRALVGGVVVHEIGRLGLEMPSPDPAQAEGIEAARRALGAETAGVPPQRG
jgi:PPK2 family polyphosphate:nucleotide phosphotransferase